MIKAASHMAGAALMVRDNPKMAASLKAMKLAEAAFDDNRYINRVKQYISLMLAASSDSTAAKHSYILLHSFDQQLSVSRNFV